jgi:hypothetical protein
MTELKRTGWRTEAVKLAKLGYHEADEALDKFAVGKDEEGLKLLSMAKLDIEAAMRKFAANKRKSSE